MRSRVWDLPIRLFHWLLAGADRLQLVVGRIPPHRLAHLVGLRDPDPAHLPLAVGLRRKLDRALRELRSRTRARFAITCAASGPASATRRSARSASSRLLGGRRRPGRARPVLRGRRRPLSWVRCRGSSAPTRRTKCATFTRLWFNVMLGLIALHVRRSSIYRLRGQNADQADDHRHAARPRSRDVEPMRPGKWWVALICLCAIGSRSPAGSSRARRLSGPFDLRARPAEATSRPC